MIIFPLSVSMAQAADKGETKTKSKAKGTKRKLADDPLGPLHAGWTLESRQAAKSDISLKGLASSIAGYATPHSSYYFPAPRRDDPALEYRVYISSAFSKQYPAYHRAVVDLVNHAAALPVAGDEAEMELIQLRTKIKEVVLDHLPAQCKPRATAIALPRPTREDGKADVVYVVSKIGSHYYTLRVPWPL
jgi:hypothetical protein